MSVTPPQPPLESCLSCGLPMDLTDVSPLTVVECPKCASSQKVFQRFGPFQLDRLLGTGGMGAVYRATDVALQRPIALKILQKKLSHDLALTAQFETEASLTARINHPNVVRVYSTGSAHGMFYIAMELVDQGSLDGLMEEKGRIPEADILRLGVQLAEGLQAADRAGLIHRDIKPGNILFSHNQQPKIVDFGLALQSNLKQTPSGEIWGTPYYISPEALAFKAEDFRSDMYALGASLWHALTGSPPHLTTSVSVHELLHLKKQQVDLQSVFPEVHPLTAAALNRTLCFDPEARFPDYSALCASFKEALELLANPKPASAAVPITEKPRVFKAATVLLLVCAIAGGVWWTQKNRSGGDPQKNVEPAFQSDAQRLAHSVALLSSPGQLDLAIRRMELIANSPGLTPELQVWTQLSLGIAFNLLNAPARQESALNNALSLAETAAPELRAFVSRWNLKPEQGASTANNSPGPWEAIEHLSMGLNALSKKNIPNAKAAFEKAARPSNPPLDASKDLLPLAGILLTQVQNFLTLEKELKEAAKPEDRPARLRRADELLQTMHPALSLRTQAAALIASAKATPVSPGETKPAPPPVKETAQNKIAPSQSAPIKTPVTPPVAPALSLERVETMRAKTTQLVQGLKFAEAMSESARFAPANEPERTAAAAIQKQAATANGLFLWAIQEINKGGTLPSPVLRNGSAFKSDPIKADTQRVFVTVSPGTPPIPVAWADISPLYLVKLVQFRLSTAPAHPQRAELLWGAGNVQLLLGSRQNAKPFLEEAARLNPSYNEWLSAILSGG